MRLEQPVYTQVCVIAPADGVAVRRRYTPKPKVGQRYAMCQADERHFFCLSLSSNADTGQEKLCRIAYTGATNVIR